MNHLEGLHDDVGDEAPLDDPQSDSPGKKGKKKRDASTLRKAPQAPKRFKSSYICFFMAKQPEIKEELGTSATVTAISKRSAEMWKNLPPEDRSHWDDVAAKDKQRYMVEKASYTGPWQIPWKRAKKDPSAPKRPMSAFLYFSQGKRSQIKKQNPEMKNTEISRLLGEMWRNAKPEEKDPHIAKEKAEREKYKVAIAEWRKEFEAKQEAQRKAQAEAMAANAEQQQQGANLTFGGDFAAAPNQQAPPYMFQGYGYPFPTGPYQFPTNGNKPVVLGPNGTPIYPPAPTTFSNQTATSPPQQQQPPPVTATQPLTTPFSPAPQTFEDGVISVGGIQPQAGFGYPVPPPGEGAQSGDN